MDFLKKFFGGKKDGGETEHSGDDSFNCVSCGEKRNVSQKKKTPDSGEHQKDGEVCEFC